MNMDVKKGFKRSGSSIVLYCSAGLVALIALALLVMNIMMFSNAVSQYVAQGYAKAEVVKQLLAIQLLPGIFEPVAVYGGIALVLFYLGRLNDKVNNVISSLVPAKPAEESFNDKVIDNNELAIEQGDLIPDGNGNIND